MIIKPLLVQVALLSERNTGWLDGTVCYVVEDSKYYQLQTGSFVELSEDDFNKLYARIDDTKGDGDTQNTWSADKVYDQLVLKQNALQIMIVQDQKAQNTGGGTFTSGAWRVRDLNTVVANTITGASLASNQITLPIGTYYIEASAPAEGVNMHQAVLYNLTDVGISLVGTSERADNTSSGQSRSFVIGVITLTTEKVYDIRHRCTTTNATYGFGYAGNFAAEVYTVCKITKI